MLVLFWRPRRSFFTFSSIVTLNLQQELCCANLPRSYLEMGNAESFYPSHASKILALMSPVTFRNGTHWSFHHPSLVVSKANHRSCKTETKLRALKERRLFETCTIHTARWKSEVTISNRIDGHKVSSGKLRFSSFETAETVTIPQFKR